MDTKEAGRRGGKSTSPKKQKAARANWLKALATIRKKKMAKKAMKKSTMKKASKKPAGKKGKC